MVYNLGDRVVNNYLVSLDEAGYVLIDTGYAENYPVFRKRLEKTGTSLKEIKYIFLTHAHDDHAGFLNAQFSSRYSLLSAANKLLQP